jgi:DNA primase (bacterial type)
MDVLRIHEVLNEVFPNHGAVDGREWVSLRCCLAPWTHASGRDKRPSAGISIHSDKMSVYSCYTCCPQGIPFHVMLQRYATYSGEDLDALIHDVEDNEYLGPRVAPDWDALKDKQYRDGDEDDSQYVLDEAIYGDFYEAAAGHPYLRTRDISDATAQHLGLLLDPEDPADAAVGVHGIERILFPVRDAKGRLFGFSGRDTTGRSKIKARDYLGMRKAYNLLGLNLVAKDPRPYVVLVEGLFDYATGWEHGHPTVCTLGANLTIGQARLLRELRKTVYLMYDNARVDKAGSEAIQIAGEQLQDDLAVMVTTYPRTEVPDPTAPGGYRPIKDPGELIKAEFDQMIESAHIYLPKWRKKA